MSDKMKIIFIILILITAGKFYLLGLKHGERKDKK